MLAKRIIPCLDVRQGKVVKGIQFKNHRIVGDILSLATYYSDSGADELVFYDISASSDGRVVDRSWINRIASTINIPFCVAGGIRTLDDAEQILNAGADKISINSPALEKPSLIDEMVAVFGQQCIVIGIDSRQIDDQFQVCQYTGRESRCQLAGRITLDWVNEVQDRGAGEIVLNCMNHDGVKSGYDIEQLQQVRQATTIPLIASGGAGEAKHFLDLFQQTDVDGALAASVFHSKKIVINQLKDYLHNQSVCVRTGGN
ncbi:MAG: imidazole glycerol phosphate synthase subunit HisF [Gammaproteobacteria bacterium]|nr:imidazole glycerol phosphate synthase subunit HisF [Gammaproteobacteria bacterium]MCP4476122.1 imidazole glycerol phosphate synthase subunit HisF [Gammaproteobacteria bacterium]